MGGEGARKSEGRRICRFLLFWMDVYYVCGMLVGAFSVLLSAVAAAGARLQTGTAGCKGRAGGHLHERGGRRVTTPCRSSCWPKKASRKLAGESRAGHAHPVSNGRGPAPISRTVSMGRGGRGGGVWASDETGSGCPSYVNRRVLVWYRWASSAGKPPGSQRHCDWQCGGRERGGEGVDAEAL